MHWLYGPRHEETCLQVGRWVGGGGGGGGANNKGPDQPARPRSLINAFVTHLLESIIFRFVTSEVSSF